ncbi:MAG: AraC family transcriptional regulator [Acetatifactor sp.]|nr:AraC family transcriptional regulator [Acetatifactor sp.]MDE7045769.1 AraC family transcriptional regulator [Acetatifactor sp.]
MGESNRNIVKRITDYVEDHLEDDLRLDKIAEELHYSKFYLARIFAGETGCTIYKYIQGRRLTLAAGKLVETEKAIVEIAYEAHYGSQQAFTLAFEQLYLCTPQEYRKRGSFYPVQPELGIQNAQNGFLYVYKGAVGSLFAGHIRAACRKEGAAA